MSTRCLGRHTRLFAQALSFTVVMLCLVLGDLCGTAGAAGLDDKIVFDIPAQPLESALLRFSQQASVQLLTSSDELPSAQSNEVSGRLAVRVALTTLLQGTGLTFSVVRDGTIAIRPAGAPSTAATSAMEPDQTRSLRLAQASSRVHADETADGDKTPLRLEEAAVSIPEILVVGSRILNMDIPRTRDDPQPYVIFDREKIEQSGATNVEEFLKLRLPMNAQRESSLQAEPNNLGGRSQINLRALGTNQTLILVDGHRIAGASISAFLSQPDINGIPLAAIERIEVLPTTASGIYGGGATGGVVNIVLRRDYSGADIKLTYDNTFNSDSAIRRVDSNAGFSLENGRTSILLAASYSEANGLSVQDRDFRMRGLNAVVSNNPAAILGAANPPVGRTTNIRSVDGSALFGPGTPHFTSVPEGYAGNGGLAPLQANAGRYNLEPADSAQPGGGRTALLNAPVVKSLMATVRREFRPNVQAFVELAGSDNTVEFQATPLNGTYTVPATAPNNPFGQAIRVTVPIDVDDGTLRASSMDRRLVGGVIVRLPAMWSAEADYTWNRSRVDISQTQFSTGTEAAAIANGTLDVLRDTSIAPLDFSPYLNRSDVDLSPPFQSTLRDTTLRVAGPVWRLPAGPVNISTLLEYRDESYSEAVQRMTTTASIVVTQFPARSQSVKSAYIEARIPLFSEANRIRAIDELQLQVAARWDRYSVEGATNAVTVSQPMSIVRAESELTSTDPTIGFRYRPMKDVMLRASYGTGFLPPSVHQVAPSFPVVPFNTSVVDPRRGNELVSVPVGFFGGNPDLEPEESESWSVGLVLTPRFAEGLRVSIDYSRIEKSDNITMLNGQGILDNESIFAAYVRRATPAPGDPFNVGPVVGIDLPFVNIARASLEAYDISLDYEVQTNSFGRVGFFSAATYTPHYETQLTPSAPIVENAGVIAGGISALKLKANAQLTWALEGWTMGWSTRYFDSYVVSRSPTPVLNQGSNGVASSQIYHDIFVRYAFGDGASRGSGILDNTEVSAGIKNIFNASPPFDATGPVGSFYSAFGDPRLASYYISLRKSF